MKISLIGPVYPYRGGIAHFTTVLAQKLMAAGHTVQVVSFKSQYPKWLYPGKSDKDFSPGREKVPAVYLLSPINPLSWQRASRAIIQFEPQLVIFSWWVTFWSPAYRPVSKRLSKAGIPISYLVHNTIPHEAYWLDQVLTRRAFEYVDSFLVMTEKEKGRLLSLFPQVPEVQVAAHPILKLFGRGEENQEAIRLRLGLPVDKSILLFFGFIRPYKGLRVLIDALKLLVGQGLDIHLLVVGEFWEDVGAYQALTARLGLEDRVHVFNEYIPDHEVGNFFTASDLFVAPYVDGTQSAALKSALGYGLPVVVTDVVTDDLIESLPERCAVVPAGDPDGLAVGIRRMLGLANITDGEVDALVDQSWDAMIGAFEAIAASQGVD